MTSNLVKGEHLVFNYSSLDLSDSQTLLATLQQLRQLVIQEGQEIFNQWRSHIQRQAFLQSSQNLAYYLALRRHDLRPLQAALMPWGLSSLGRIEARVLPNLDAAIATLGVICQNKSDSLPKHPSLAAFFEGERLLERHTEDLLGRTLSHRRVRIMVTLPTIAASNYEFVRDLIQRGTNCVRINCAHDTSVEWSAMIANVRMVEAETEQKCKVLMDLAGPKPRIGIARCLRHAGANAPNAKQGIFRGECLLLTRDLPTTNSSICFQANCTIPEVLDQLEVGASVWIDDGHIGAKVESITEEGVLLRITHARFKGEKIGADKGLNFPDTILRFSPLTEKDRQDLDFVATHADIVGYSFVQEPADIELLQRELQARLPANVSIPGIIAKIETPLAVSNLPELIVQAAGKQPFGIMIARGDLAVEIGYQRLAEIQEEILWLCEAAHVPVIWATQVMENLVKNGTPSRAEITDAAMAERAECVMLNKGAYIAEAVTILDDVLTRMQAHQVKKTPQLRALHSW
ncbi:pyruvate kinase [Brunnivagina elsteri]|uniref:Pyruvate kinase n=1 Tax=Brunnivagina elsteri CCALA 953 TaxID=987040 RepID=A0A2A2TBP4_9CYAN|nr:pyruvate kinase [Calothrix elsteri]PAX51217.1 pyruvate kinase [Calothrix elsteri CCALA 953]